MAPTRKMDAESQNGDGRVIRSATRDVLTVWAGFLDFVPTDAGYERVTLRKDVSDPAVERG